MVRFFLVLCLFAVQNSWAKNFLKGIRYNATPDNVEIVFDTSNTPQYEQSTLDNPPRLLIDLIDTNSHVNGNLLINKGNVVGVRIGRKNALDLRLVIDLQKHLGGEISLNHSDPSNGHRLIANIPNVPNTAHQNLNSSTAEVMPQPVASVKTLPTPTPSPATNKNNPPQLTPPPPKNEAFEMFNNPQFVEPTEVKITTQNRPEIPMVFAPKTANINTSQTIAPPISKPKKNPTQMANFKNSVVVVLDAGHGGKDPGAISRVNGIKEKEAVLQIAKRLRTHLEKRSIKVFMTRDSDVYIPLRGRVDIARKHKADLFISIHADSAQSPTASGTSIYALSTKGATSQLAKYLENSENAVDLKWEVDVKKYDNETQELLLSMQQEGTIESSLLLGSKILDEVSRLGRIHKNKVERANFVVLRAPEIPSILIETAFLSNQKDAELLVNPEYQENLARSIAVGIEHYFNEHLPQHILLRR